MLNAVKNANCKQFQHEIVVQVQCNIETCVICCKMADQFIDSELIAQKSGDLACMHTMCNDPSWCEKLPNFW